MIGKLLCKMGFHKWEKYHKRDDNGELEIGRKCNRCPKYQWTRETYVRRYYRNYGDVPMTDRQRESLKKWGTT